MRVRLQLQLKPQVGLTHISTKFKGSGAALSEAHYEAEAH
jgi:hypothetical protein